MYNVIDLMNLREVKVELWVAITLNTVLPQLFEHFVQAGNKVEFKFAPSIAYQAEDIVVEVCSRVSKLGYVCRWEKKENTYYIGVPNSNP